MLVAPSDDAKCYLLPGACFFLLLIHHRSRRSSSQRVYARAGVFRDVCALYSILELGVALPFVRLDDEWLVVFPSLLRILLICTVWISETGHPSASVALCLSAFFFSFSLSVCPSFSLNFSVCLSVSLSISLPVLSFSPLLSTHLARLTQQRGWHVHPVYARFLWRFVLLRVCMIQ